MDTAWQVELCGSLSRAGYPERCGQRLLERGHELVPLLFWYNLLSLQVKSEVLTSLLARFEENKKSQKKNASTPALPVNRAVPLCFSPCSKLQTCHSSSRRQPIDPSSPLIAVDLRRLDLRLVSVRASDKHVIELRLIDWLVNISWRNSRCGPYLFVEKVFR